MSARITEIKGIERLCQIAAGWSKMNLGGLIELYAFDERSIVKMPDYRFSFDAGKRYVLEGTIMLRKDAVFYRFQFTNDTARFTETQQENDQGVYYEQSLNAIFPKDRADLIWLKHTMRNNRYTLLYRDSNGIVKVLRNQRVKFDLDTGTTQSDKNRYGFQSRRLSKFPAPVLADPITDEEVIDDISTAFEETTISFARQVQQYPAGIVDGVSIQMNQPAFTTRGYQVILNQAVYLKRSRDFVTSTEKITFKTNVEGASRIDIIYPVEDVADAIAGFGKYIETYTAAYAAGTSFQLPNEPISDEHLKIIYNDTLLLEQGTDYNRVGDTIFLLFDGSPTATDTDTFHCMFSHASGSSIDIQGWDNFTIRTTRDIEPNTAYKLKKLPINGSIEVYLNDAILLREGTDYTTSGGFLDIIQKIEKAENGNFNEVRVYHAY